MPALSAYMKEILETSRAFCEKRGLSELTPDIVFRHLIAEDQSEYFAEHGVAILSEIGGSLPLMRTTLDNSIDSMGDEVPTKKKVKVSEELGRIMKSMGHLENCRSQEAGGAEFILCVLRDETNSLASVLHSFDINYAKYHAKYYNSMPSSHVGDDDVVPHTAGAMRIPNIQTYSRNLTKEAGEGKLDPVAGRSSEIDNVIRVLCRRTKNNPVLVGPAGCGKTAIVEGLAQRIAHKEVPQHLLDVEIFQLDLVALMAGTRFRGDFEKRIQGVINEAENYPNIILFIDEIHTIMGTGAGAEDGLDMGNILKPALSRGKLSLIGATTQEEFDRTIDKNAAMKRRFDRVDIDEPDRKALLSIIQTVLDHCSCHYNIKYDETVTPEFIVELSQYVNTSANPDKSIEIIDSAFANVTFEINTVKGQEDEDKESIVQLRYNQRLMNRVDLIYAAEKISHIPARFLDVSSDKECIGEADRFLHNRIINQDEATERLIQILTFSRARLNDPNAPRCVEYFDGPEGVGKTELAYLFAEIVLGSRDKAFRVDLSQYRSEMHLTKLTGATPGYVGYNDGNNDLLTHIRRNNVCVVILDEIDSCSPEILDFFVGMFERGAVEDSHGRSVPINNCYFFLTGNVTSKIVRGDNQKPLGFSSEAEDTHSAAMKAIKRRFSKKFLDRLDHITVFNNLSEEDLEKILDIEIVRMNSYMHQVKFRLDQSAKDEIVKALVGSGGARCIRRQLNDKVKPQIAEAIKHEGSQILVEIYYDESFQWRKANGKHNFQEITTSESIKEE